MAKSSTRVKVACLVVLAYVSITPSVQSLKDDGNIRNYQVRLESWRRFLQSETGQDVSQIDDDSFPLGELTVLQPVDAGLTSQVQISLRL